MQLQINVKNNKVAELLNSLRYTKIEEAAYDMMLLSAHSQYAEYLSETRQFEKKYRTTFNEFQKKMETVRYEEDFEKEDDYMDWKFAQDGVCYWKEKISELNSWFSIS